MIKRATWFVGGAIAGVAGTSYAKRKVKATAAQLTPSNLAKSAVAKVRTRAHDVVAAAREGREAMKAKEAELRAQLELEPGVEPCEPIDATAVETGAAEPSTAEPTTAELASGDVALRRRSRRRSRRR